MKEKINTILQQRMDRRSFLKNCGIALLVIVGLGSALKLLQQQTPANTTATTPKPAPSAYGMSAYGR